MEKKQLGVKEKFAYGIGAVGIIYSVLLSGHYGSERGGNGCDTFCRKDI